MKIIANKYQRAKALGELETMYQVGGCTYDELIKFTAKIRLGIL